MRQTREYSASQYVRDHGFPLAWIFRLFTTKSSLGAAEEAKEHHQQALAGRKGKIIGRAAGREAYTGESALRFQEKSRVTTSSIDRATKKTG